LGAIYIWDDVVYGVAVNGSGGFLDHHEQAVRSVHCEEFAYCAVAYYELGLVFELVVVHYER
jgi:hypothetical protein